MFLTALMPEVAWTSMIEASLIHTAHWHGVQMLFFLDSPHAYTLSTPTHTARATRLSGPCCSRSTSASVRTSLSLRWQRPSARVTGFRGELVTDPGKSDNTPRKLLDVSRLQTLG